MVHVLFRLLVAVSIIAYITSYLRAADANPGAAADRAATATLPAALQALEAGQPQVLARQQAQEIRGQWWIEFANRNGSIFFQGVGSPFSLSLLTDSRYDPNRYVGLRVTIGR